MRDVLAGPGRPLDRATRARFEAGLGVDLRGVRIHDDAFAARSAERLGAAAYSVGADVVFARGRYAPDSPDGRLLLGHELAHVAQARGGRGASGPLLVEGPESAAETEAASAAGRLARGERVRVAERPSRALARQPAEAAGPPPGETSLLWFELNSDELRDDGDVDSVTHLLAARERIERHHEAFGDEQRILVHGYASVEGDEGHNLELSGRRAIRVKNLLVDRGIDSSRIVVLAHGPDDSLPGLECNRRVEIELTPPVSAVEFDEPTTVTAAPCACPPGSEAAFDEQTVALVESMADDIARVAARRGVPPIAVAGAIAEEYQARRGIRVIVDGAQDAVLDALFEWQIDVDRYFDIHSKLLNALENDVGAPNFNVRTALSLVEAGEVEVPGSPPTDPQVELVIDHLLEEKGAVEFTGAYVAHAQSLFEPFVADYEEGLREAVLVEYFNQGDAYYGRFLAARGRTPGHTPCPGDAGCLVLYNRAALEAALSAGAP